MTRIVSVWLEQWPIARFLRAHGQSAGARGIDPDRPFALSVEAAGGPRVAAANTAAMSAGVAPGDRLADARAKAGRLEVRPMDPEADRAALERLSLWASRYTPVVAPWDAASGGDGFFLDVAGAAHLWGGEAGLVADLKQRLEGFGLCARVVLAGTAGAGWALARFGEEAMLVLEVGREAEALAPLSVEGLRVSPETSAALRRLGLKRIGDLFGQPRAPLAARFGRGLLARLDGALGRAPEPLVPLPPPPAYEARRDFASPVHTQEAVVAVAGELMRELVPDLERDGVGAWALRLGLYRLDGDASFVEIGLAAPTRDPRHVARLVGLRLERLGGALDAAFGFETLRLEVLDAEPLAERTGTLVAGGSEADGSLAALLDALVQKLGRDSVRRLWAVESFWPERACLSRASGEGAPPPWPDTDALRPLMLLSRAEPAEVVALIPDGPPRRFRWRGADRRVAHAQGPERIAPEWWRDAGSGTRDYYVVEDDGGHRFWMFREGLYGRESDTPRWFVHGLFP